MNIKKCLLIISSLACFSRIDAGWRDQWVWFKSLFSGFSIKRPSLTRKQVVIGGVGALAVAGAAWWWLKSPKKPTNQNKDKNVTLEREMTQSNIVSNQPKEIKDESPIELTINQPKEVKYEPVLVDKTEMYLKYDAQDFFGILDHHSDNHSKKGFSVETIDIDIKTKEQKILKIEEVKANSIKNVVLKPITKNFQIQENSYVFVNHPIDAQKIMLIGKYVSRDDDKVMVLSGSLFHDVELNERTYDASDVFVPEPVVEQKNEAVKSSVNQEELTKDTEAKKRKLEQTESELEAAKREKLLLESQLETEKKFFSIKQANDFLKQTNELTDFEKLLIEYENNKDKETLKQLTEQFEKLNPTILKDSKKLWESLTNRYNAIIESK